MAIEDPYTSSGGGSHTSKHKTATSSTAGGTTTPSTPVEQGKQAAAGAIDQAREMAMSQLSAQKTRAAETVGNLAESLRQAGSGMDSQLPVGGYMRRAADQLEDLSRTLQTKDVEELVSDVEDFARSQPALFLGAAFTAGLLAARFLKSSKSSVSMRDRAQQVYRNASGSMNDYAREASTMRSW